MERYFEHVFFVQEELAREWIEMIDKHGREQVLDSLLHMFWYPGQHETYSDSKRGSGDPFFLKSLDRMSDDSVTYIGHLNYNRDLPYIGVDIEVARTE